MLEIIQQDFDCSIYQTTKSSQLNTYLISTPETRHICCDPTFMGDQVTHGLKQALSRTIAQLKFYDLFDIKQTASSLLLPSKASLAFPVREALQESLGWNRFNTFFSSEDLHSCQTTNVILAEQGLSTNTTEKWFNQILSNEYDQVENIFFFAFASHQYLEIVKNYLEKSNKLKERNTNITVFVFEGIFEEISIDGDSKHIFSKKDANLAPELVDNHYHNPVFSIIRCPLNDLSNRVFAPLKYISLQTKYWNDIINMAELGRTYIDLSNEKYPFIDADAFGNISLKDEALKILDKLS
ncbi:hypothetical protein K5X82_01320 [Halosquirtibacter xylanolyticus]|uniref:hypothetical protein n=1 Tax=Halosquirtibacter xylanolyticus TaxID=3374599 RepID=UPI00374A68D4|nr:hypothetical protein K5X82_01320 [Prolixibacteraceae bacterium]